MRVFTDKLPRRFLKLSAQLALKLTGRLWRGRNLRLNAPLLLTAVSFLAVAFSILSPRTPPASAAPGINTQINFQARLYTAAGAVIPDGNYNIEFKIYCGGNGLPGATAANCNHSTDEQLLWTESRINNNSQGVTVRNGYFSVALGSIASLSSVDFNDDKLWLSLNVGNTNPTCTPFSNCSPDGEMSPFQRFGSNAYSFNSQALGGLTSSQFVQLAQGLQTDSSTTNASIAINKTGGTANLLQLQRGGADVQVIANDGSALFKNQTDSATGFRIQSATAAQTLFTANTSDNIIKIGDSIGTDTATTVLQVDATTTDPTTSLSSRNGGLYYNSTDNQLKVVENGAVARVCTTTAVCAGYAPASGGAGYVSLQATTPGSQQTGNINVDGALIAGTSISTLTVTTPSGDLTIDPTLNLKIIGSTSDNTAFALNVVNSGGSTSLLNVRNDGNVGIGATNPTAKLEVRDVNKFTTTSFSADPANATLGLLTADNQAVDKGAVIGLGGAYNNAGDPWLFGAIKGAKENGTTGNTNGYLAFYTGINGLGGAFEHMRITSAGNVGIGTVSPTSARLVIQGSTSDNSASALNLINSGGSTSLLQVRNDGVIATGNTINANATSGDLSISRTASQTTGAIIFGNSGNHNLYFNGSNLFQLSDPLQTSGSNNRLTVSSTGANELAGIQLTARTGSVNKTWIIDNRGGADAPNNRLAFYDPATTTERLTILESGNVGIGATNPTSVLHTVATGAKTASYTGNLLTNTATSSTDSVNKYGLEIQSTGTWNGGSANNVGLYVSSVTGGTNNYDAIFNGGGNVGIGTNAPTYKLQVQGNSGFFGTNFDSNNATSALDVNGAFITIGDMASAQTLTNGIGIKFADLGVAHASIKYLSSAQRLDFCNSSNGATLTCNANAEALSLDLGNNRVGIGTTGPDSKLHVVGGGVCIEQADSGCSAASGSLTVNGPASGDALTVSNDASTGNIAIFKDNATSVVTVADGGFITLQPTAALTGSQTHIIQAANVTGSTAGATRGYQFNSTITNATNPFTNIGFEINQIDNATALANTNTGLKVTLSGSNTGQSQLGVDVSTSQGIAIRGVTSGLAGSAQLCANLSTSSVGVCGDSTSTSSTSYGVYGRNVSSGGSGVGGINTATGTAAGTYIGIGGRANQSTAAAYTSIGAYGEAKGGSGATTYGGYFTFDSSSTATLGSALYASNSTVANNILQLQDNTTDVVTVADGGAATFKNQTDSSAAFQVQNQNSHNVLSVDTTAGAVIIGKGSNVNGSLVVSNSTNANTITLNSGITSGSYNLTLPTTQGALEDCMRNNGSGVLTWSACGAASGTLQGAYNASVSPASITTVNDKNFVINAADTANDSGIIFNLQCSTCTAGTNSNGGQFQIQAAGTNIFTIAPSGSAGVVALTGTYLQRSDSATAFVLQNTSSENSLVFDGSTKQLRVYENAASPTRYANIYYDNAANEAVFTASSGITRIGSGSGNIAFRLLNAADVMTTTKTVTAGASYSATDFSVIRNITGGSNALTGNVAKIEDLSTFSGGSSAPNLLYINQNNTGATGNLILAQTAASNDKFKVDVQGTVTIAAGQSYTGAGALNLSSAAGTALTVTGNASSTFSTSSGALTVTSAAGATWSTTTGNLTIQAGGTNKVIVKPGADSTSSFEIQKASGSLMFSADTTNSRLYVGPIAGDTIGTILVLGNKTDSGDPAGVNGAMYYNSNAGKFRCYEAGAWRDCLSSSKFIVKGSAESVNGSTVLQDDDNLSFTIGPNETWAFHFVLLVSNSNNSGPDWKSAILASGSASCNVTLSGSEPAGAVFPQVSTTDCTTPANLVNSAIIADADAYNVSLQGRVTAGGSGGTVKLQWAQNTSTGVNLDVRGGSYVIAQKVGAQ